MSKWFDKSVEVKLGHAILLSVLLVFTFIGVVIISRRGAEDLGITAVLVIQAIGTFFIATAFIVYFLQLLTMRKNAKDQNLIVLINHLQENEVRKARRTVINKLHLLQLSEWIGIDDYEDAAGLVCSTYDVAGIMIKKGLVDSEPILDNWGRSIIWCYQILVRYIVERRKASGDKYWDDFVNLYRMAAIRHPDVDDKGAYGNTLHEEEN